MNSRVKGWIQEKRMNSREIGFLKCWHDWMPGFDTYERGIAPTDYKLVLTGSVQNHCG